MLIKSILKKIIISCNFINKHMSDERYVKLLFFIEFGYIPNLKEPKTFNERICSRKLSDSMLSNWKYADKYEVKKYISDTIGDKYLIKCLGCYDSFADIDFSKLPNSFALKCNHSSGQNLIVKNKANLDYDLAKKKFDKWLSTNYYKLVREKNYKQIVPKIIAEEYIDLSRYIEYKLFCFGGKLKFLTTNHYIENKRYSNLYDTSGELLPVKWGYEPYKGFTIKETVLKELTEIAEELSAPFDFVRVDLYCDDENVLFSELTFNPGSGYVKFSPSKYDNLFGKLFD